MSPQPDDNFLAGIDLESLGEAPKPAEKPQTRCEYGSDLTIGMIIVDEVHNHSAATFISGNGPRELMAALMSEAEPHVTYKRLEIVDIRREGGMTSCKCVDLATLGQEPAYVADIQQVDVLVV